MATMEQVNDESTVRIDRDYPELRDSVRKLCAAYPGKYWQDLDVKGDYPDAFVKAMGDAGYLAALIPEQYGGSGLPFRAAQVILQTVHEEGCNAGACIAQMYTMGTVLKHGNKSQKEHYLPKIATGELRLQSFGVTEPGAGTDTLRLKTRAVRDGDRYLINGQKIWISRTGHTDLMLLLARTTPVEEMKHKKHGLSVFLVDVKKGLRDKTIEIRPIDIMTNHLTYEVFFNDAVVPVENRIGEEGEGFTYILSGMNAERTLACGAILGNGNWFIRKAVEYANQRVVFGRPISANQGIQFPIADTYTQLDAADLMAPRRHAARCRQALRLRGERGQAPVGGGGMEGGRSVHADLRRIRRCPRVRRGTGLARDPSFPRRPHLDQPDPGVHRPECPWDAPVLLNGVLLREGYRWPNQGRAKPVFGVIV